MARAWRWCAVVLIAAGVVWGKEPIRDEGLRRETLAAVWPGAKVSVVEGKRIDDTFVSKGRQWKIVFPDTFSAETVYHVVGAPVDSDEECAAYDMGTDRTSHTREVRFRAWTWPGSTAGSDNVLAVVQYRFPDVMPAFSCPSIARVVRAIRIDGKLQKRDDFTFETAHHRGVEDARLVDLAGAGVPELLVESDWGGYGVFESNLMVFSLGGRRFKQLLNISCRGVLNFSDVLEVFEKTLDVARTQREHGERFCFNVTSFAHDGKWLDSPQKSLSCEGKLAGVRR